MFVAYSRYYSLYRNQNRFDDACVTHDNYVISRYYYYYYYYYYKCHGLECCRHTVAGALYKNLDLKLLHSSVQTSADHRSRRRRVSRMTDEKGETVCRCAKCKSHDGSLKW